jgi:hypothetical protein
MKRERQHKKRASEGKDANGDSELAKLRETVCELQWAALQRA